MSDLLSQNENYSSIVDTSVNSASLAGGVSEASLASALSASVPIVNAYGSDADLSSAQLKNGVLHHITVNPPSGSGDLNLKRSEKDIVKDLGFTRDGQTAVLKFVNFGSAAANDNVQFNGTDVLLGGGTSDNTIAYVLLEVADIDAAEGSIFEAYNVIAAPTQS